MAGDEVMIICPETPFYAEAGGQAGDQGELVGPQGRAQVLNTVPIAQGRTAHQARVTEGSLGTGEAVELKVTEGRRQKIADNHTATHLLQATLRQVLGEHVKQSGSLVDPERLRFDFTHFSPLTGPEIMAVETMVNEEIRANRQVTTAMLSRAEAQQSGAMALFGEKYGDTVRVVSAGDFSKELCGGTHVGATGEIGLMKIIAETGIAAGVRRIEAVTGPAAFQRLQDHEQLLSTLADRLRCGPEELTVRVEKLLARQKELEREVGRLTAKLSTTDLDAQMAGAKTVDNIRIVTLQVPLDSAKTLREVGDRVRDKLGSGAAILGGVLEDKVALLAIVSKDLVGRLHAGNIIKEVATLVDGSGGGRPDMAQAGGTRPDKLAHALAQAAVIIEKQIAATA